MCTFCTVTAPGTSNCSAAKRARQINLSHVVPLPRCDTPIANTLIYTRSALPVVLVVFAACFLLPHILGFLLPIINPLNTCSLLISNILFKWYFLWIMSTYHSFAPSTARHVFNKGPRHLYLVYTGKLHSLLTIPNRPGVFCASLCSFFACNQSLQATDM